MLPFASHVLPFSLLALRNLALKESRGQKIYCRHTCLVGQRKDLLHTLAFPMAFFSGQQHTQPEGKSEKIQGCQFTTKNEKDLSTFKSAIDQECRSYIKNMATLTSRCWTNASRPTNNLDRFGFSLFAQEIWSQIRFWPTQLWHFSN